ncbi:hypothetical protein [Hydrogenophaga sp.]|uniref:hypothetical protein n=1 Tax=Hydrogenophaga sp. TaxID=1904254 RepID=UPI00271F4F15|nr:hypothetical protein [Hydrogenophaga sp.]MDO9436762.1 hypothetical protein [Hydrogenophaga sp.]
MTNTHTGVPQDDAALRTRLHGALAHTVHPDESDALQARVIAQWQQRRPLADAMLAQASGSALRGGGVPPHRRLWWTAGALLIAALLFSVAPWQRPDPALDELLQLDVLSLISLGEM